MYRIIENGNIIDNIRFYPFFVDQLMEYRTASFVAEDSRYQALLQEKDKNPDYFYFLASSENTLINSLILQLSLFVGLNTLRLLFYLLKHKVPFCGKLHFAFSRVGVWWALSCMILEPNIRSLAFSSFLQMSPPMLGYFGYANKLNFCAASISMFVVLLYSLAFYLLAYRLAGKSYAKMLLSCTKFKPSSFFFESFTRLMRNFINAFFHGYFMFEYRRQIVGLMSAQALFILVSVYFRTRYINAFVFASSLLYYVLFFVFNVVLVMAHLHQELFMQFDYDLFTEIFIYVLIGSAVAINLVIVVS
jgi:hypothetical protein